MNSVNGKKLKWEEVMPGMRRKVLHAESFTIVLVDLAPNLDLPCHSHPHEQATLVQRGSLVFTVENETRTVGSGEVIRIPPDAEHRAVVGEKGAEVVDMFAPRRDEFAASTLKDA